MFQPELDELTDQFRSITIRRLPEEADFVESGATGVTWTSVSPYLPGGGLTTGVASSNVWLLNNTKGFKEIDISNIVIAGQLNVITLQIKGPPEHGSFVVFASREFMKGAFAPRIILA